MAILTEGGLIALAAVTGWISGSSPFASIRWRWLDAAWGVAGACPLLLLFVLGTRLGWEPARRLSRVLDRLVHFLFAEATHLDLALVSCLAGLGEEAFFRGGVQALLGRWVGTPLALAAASAAFAAAHLVTPAYAAVAGLAGLYLGWLFLASGNLLVPILAHALYDFLALVYVRRGWIAGATHSAPPGLGPGTPAGV